MGSAALTSPALPGVEVSRRWALSLMPCLTDLAFLLPAVFLFLKLSGPGYLLKDGDTGWHIRTGEWIIQHRAVPTVDLFSFTKADAPWYAWEWGWDVLFALIHQWSGLAGIAAANLLILCFVSGLLYLLIVRETGNPILAFSLSAVAVTGSAIHWLARPHLLSWVFILLFLHVTSRAKAKPHLLWILPPLTVVWANFHGSFFAGIILILTGGIEAASEHVRKEKALFPGCPRGVKPYLACACACFAASFVNPYGWHLHQHILRYLTDSQLLAQIAEYQSVSFHGGLAACFELMLLLGAAAALWCLQTGRVGGFVALLFWAHLALTAGRNVPIFLFVAAPWVARMMQDLAGRAHSLAGIGPAIQALREITSEIAQGERIRRVHLLPVLTVCIASWTVSNSNYRNLVQFDANSFPEKALPLLQARTGRVFTSDQWGDYLIYRLYPGVRVFVDGRNDLYGAAFMSEYGEIMSGRFDCEEKLQRFEISTVLLKPSSALATVLKRSSRWDVLMDSGSAILFGTRQKKAPQPSSPRNFAKIFPVPPNGEKS